MKKIFNSLTIAAFGLLAAGTAQAQATSCGATAPAMQNAIHPDLIGNGVWTPAAATYLDVTGSSEVPNLEYLVTLKNSPAMTSMGTADTTGGGGDVIIGTSVDGIFHPSMMDRYGYSIQNSDSFELVAVGYDLSQVKTLADALLNNDISPGKPCCNIFTLIPDAGGFCDSVNNAGINSAADINNLNDVLAIFDALSDAEMSAESLVSLMSLVNSYQSTIPPSCGQSALPVCYGIDADKRYTYVAADPVSVDQIESIVGFSMFPNPATEGYVNINLRTNTATDLEINAYNILGTQVYAQNLGSVNGQFSTTIETGAWSAGVYMIELTDGNNKEVIRLVVQ